MFLALCIFGAFGAGCVVGSFLTFEMMDMDSAFNEWQRQGLPDD